MTNRKIKRYNQKGILSYKNEIFFNQLKKIKKIRKKINFIVNYSPSIKFFNIGKYDKTIDLLIKQLENKKHQLSLKKNL